MFKVFLLIGTYRICIQYSKGLLQKDQPFLFNYQGAATLINPAYKGLFDTS